MSSRLLAAAGVYADYLLTLAYRDAEGNPLVVFFLRLGALGPLLWLALYASTILMLIHVNMRVRPGLAYLPALVPLAATCFNLAGVMLFELGGPY